MLFQIIYWKEGKRMKRLIVFLITFTFIFQLLSPTVYAEADLNHTKFEDDLYEFFQSDYYKNLLDRDKYSYMKFASDFRSDIISQYLIETVDYLINTGVEPDVDEYIKTLAAYTIRPQVFLYGVFRLATLFLIIRPEQR